MARVEHSVDVDVSVQTAYNQWTQFESFPEFMEAVKEVRQVDDTHLHWVADVAGKHEEWDAEITEQIPDERIAWRSINGAPNAGVVTFHRLGSDKTRIMLQIETEPQRISEKVGEALGFLQRQVKEDLERFKKFVESRGTETGAWRGEVQAPHHRTS
jgi:uncharacterized membrane protein